MRSIEENKRRYLAAGHAIQSGVAMEHSMGSDDGSPKHLRVGINLRATDAGGLAKLLVDKGVITDEEYLEAIVDAAEAEQKAYEDRLGPGVTLA